MLEKSLDFTSREHYFQGDLVIFAYKNSEGEPYRFDLGVVKSCHDGIAFVANNQGDSYIRIDVSELIPVHNEYALGALVERKRQSGLEIKGLCETAEDWSKK